jgi:uncharacterized membrane protein
MKYWKKAVLFYLGGMIYCALELIWRGWTHGSMFLLGGLCFLLIGRLSRTEPRLPLIPRLLLAAAVVTALELGCGLLVNRQYQVWDYRSLPLNFHGQICLPFTVLWLPVCAAAEWIYGRLGFFIDKAPKPMV